MGIEFANDLAAVFVVAALAVVVRRVVRVGLVSSAASGASVAAAALRVRVRAGAFGESDAPAALERGVT